MRVGGIAAVLQRTRLFDRTIGGADRRVARALADQAHMVGERIAVGVVNAKLRLHELALPGDMLVRGYRRGRAFPAPARLDGEQVVAVAAVAGFDPFASPA